MSSKYTSGYRDTDLFTHRVDEVEENGLHCSDGDVHLRGLVFGVHLKALVDLTQQSVQVHCGDELRELLGQLPDTLS